MKKITINNYEYELIEDDGNCFSLDDIIDKVTDYFDNFDYIFGDYSYDKVRLKGFYDENNKLAKEINNIKLLDEYKNNYCSYGCKTFLLKKIK